MANSWLHTNLIKTVQKTLVADSQQTEYPSANLQTDNYTQPWRTADAAGAHNCVNDFGSAQTVDCCFLGNVNIRSSGTVSIQGNATDAWGAPTVNQAFTMSGLGLDPPHRNLFVTFGSSSQRFWRILITDVSNPAGYYQVGEWFLGVRVSMATGQDFQSEHEQTYQRNNVIHQTEWLQKYAYTRADRRVFGYEWRAITAATRTQFRVLERAAKGTALPFVWIPDVTASPAESFFVRMAGDMRITQVTPTHYNIQTSFEEEGFGKDVPAV
jgi:hypothetical protein